MHRRDFLRRATAAAFWAGPAAGALAAQSQPAADRFVGVQIHPFSFYDEGPERVLDLLQETAGVNALLVYTHLYGADQGVPLDVLAHDHPGFVPRDPARRKYRRVWARHDPRVFQDQRLRHPSAETAVEYAGKDLFAELQPLCEKRGIKLMGRILEPRGSHGVDLIQGFAQVLTIDLDGKPGVNACWNHPDYRAFWQTTVADTFRHNPLTGFMLGAERTGPLYRLIQSGETPSCFCPHCLARMKDQEISERRLRAGYTEITRWIQSMRRQTRRPADGALVTFLRLVMRHPEVLAWERQWALSLEEAFTSLRQSIRSVKPDAVVGRHIDHQQSTWDIFYRAAVSYGEMAQSMDFVKPVVYHDVAAPRVNQWLITEFGKSILSDLSKPQSLELYYAVFGLDPAKEPALTDMPEGGFSPDYVYRETKRCVDGVAGKARVYPGIGFDIPFHRINAPPRPHPSDPDQVAAATRKAIEAGADGVIICREYQEMRLPNLRAVGRALRGA
jgi:hypothetical protein